jgi:hypothetical protein
MGGITILGICILGELIHPIKIGAVAIKRKGADEI